MPIKKKNYNYYSYDQVLSRNGVFNFIVGGRGYGKTYGAKKFVINKFLKTGEQFIYLRRYRTEMSGKKTFFSDIEHEWPEYEFRVNGTQAEIRPRVYEDEDECGWDVIGFFVTLSNAGTQKSIAYPLVTTIIFDEFIILKGAVRYLPNEVKAFNEFYSTVDRWQDKTRVLFLANAVSVFNPYFVEYDIQPDGKEWYRRHNGFIVAHFPNSDTFESAVLATRYGAFLKKTDPEYVDYSIHNVFNDNDAALHRTKPPWAKYLYTVESRVGVFSVWREFDDELQKSFYYITNKKKSEKLCLTVKAEHVKGSTLMLENNDPFMKGMRTAFAAARMYFQNNRVQAAFMDLMKGM